MGPLQYSCHRQLQPSANVQVRFTLRGGQQLPSPVPMPTGRCPQCPGLRPPHSARPAIHPRYIQRDIERPKMSLLRPRRAAAAHRRDRDAWRVGHRPRPAARRLLRSGFGDSRRTAQKTGRKSVQIGPSRVEIYNENLTFIYTRRRPVPTRHGVWATIFTTSALPLQAPAIVTVTLSHVARSNSSIGLLDNSFIVCNPSMGIDSIIWLLPFSHHNN